jgi:hypothetical protein
MRKLWLPCLYLFMQVYYNLTEHEQAVFDEFESDDYEKCLVNAILMVRHMSLFCG